ncbi:MAG: hypothetical protein HRT99_03005 [Mycoplasmatales bacterium]|nr:hypothetical protein [Mycoplasmatales bacterium]
MKKNNVLSKYWFSLIGVPIFLFIAPFIWWNEMDRYVFEWFAILTISLLVQIYLFRGSKYGDKVVHILFIVFSILISMFISHFLHRYANFNLKWEWLEFLFSSLVQASILFIIKTILWFILVGHLKHIRKLKNNFDTLKDENELLTKKLNQQMEINENLEMIISDYRKEEIEEIEEIEENKK